MTERELTAETVVDRVVPRTPRLSPDGQWVAYVTAAVGRTGKHPVSALWLVPADGSAPPRELATGAAEHREPRWTADSGAVLFLSDRDKRGTAQLYRIGLTGEAPERLTDLPAGIQGHLALPDRGSVVVIAPEERDEPADPRVWTVRGPGARPSDAAGPATAPTWEGGARLDRPGGSAARRTSPDRLWLLDVETAAVRRLGDLGDRHVRETAVRPDGRVLAVVTWSDADREPGSFEPGLHLVDLATGATQYVGAPALEASSPAWWQDGTGWHLAYLGLTPPGLIGGTAVFDAFGAAGLTTNLTAGLPVCPDELTQVDGGPPLALFAEGLDTTVRRLDPATGRFETIADVSGASLTASRTGEIIAVIGSTGTTPEEVHAGPPGKLTRLSRTAPEDVRWGSQHRLHYRAGDGLDLDGLFLLPPGKTTGDGPFPLVTLVHGGPRDRYADRFDLGWYPSGQWLAAAGFAVFLPNARGGLGHGHAFAASVAGDVGGAEFTDVLTGIDLLVGRGVADPARLGIGGWSQGGFFAASAVTQTDRFAAAVVGAGVTDWRLMAATGEHSRFEAALGGPGMDTSPITHADRIRTPVLILHGEDDPNVPLSQAQLLHCALGDREHEFVVYPREHHSIRERDHQLDVLRRSREWFSRWLTPARPA